ncbi:hypothetical protein C4573_02815 [Candidatus Woesearchaeota archaeon]|nr:MAG: hypothetical protein C4573_02815 [Candidatus Woesearchaeota archaeon]
MTFDRKKCIAILEKINSVFKNVEQMVKNYEQFVLQNMDDDEVLELRKTIIDTLKKLRDVELSVRKDDLEGKVIPLVKFQDEEIAILTAIAAFLTQLKENPERKKDIEVLMRRFDKEIIEEITALSKAA